MDITQTAPATAAHLLAGDRVLVQHATTSKGIILPITAENPGTVETVAKVAPWILTAGPRAGQPALRGRGAKALPLHVVTFESGAERAVTIDQVVGARA